MLTNDIEELEKVTVIPAARPFDPWEFALATCLGIFVVCLFFGLLWVYVLAFRSLYAEFSGTSVVRKELVRQSPGEPGLPVNPAEESTLRDDVSTNSGCAAQSPSFSPPETPCAFDCNSFQVVAVAMDYYLNRFKDVQSITLPKSVTPGPWANTCDIAFNWTRKADAGSVEDFRRFLFEQTTDSACTFKVSAIGIPWGRLHKARLRRES